MGVFHLVDGHTVLDQYLAPEQGQDEPVIEPGQIWLVECAPASLCTVHARLLARANVVLYESALLAALADALPIGIYAEKLQATAESGPAIAPRALQFAADGWSVLQLVERQAGWRRLLRSVTEEPCRAGAGTTPLLAVGTITAGRYRQWLGTAADLAIIAAELGPDDLLILIFAPPGTSPGALPVSRPAASGQAFTANGLAG
jgi:hypothetical protein